MFWEQNLLRDGIIKSWREGLLGYMFLSTFWALSRFYTRVAVHGGKRPMNTCSHAGRFQLLIRACAPLSLPSSWAHLMPHILATGLPVWCIYFVFNLFAFGPLMCILAERFRIQFVTWICVTSDQLVCDLCPQFVSLKPKTVSPLYSFRDKSESYLSYEFDHPGRNLSGIWTLNLLDPHQGHSLSLGRQA